MYIFTLWHHGASYFFNRTKPERDLPKYRKYAPQGGLCLQRCQEPGAGPSHFGERSVRESFSAKGLTPPILCLIVTTTDHGAFLFLDISRATD